MATLDFKEIPEAHTGANRDCFELFAREFLNHHGFEIIEDPDRGADGGRDLIVDEKRIGIAGETTIRWLVSCKHKAHSGNSVGVGDEIDIRDRVETNKCDGFLAFYSTVPSSGLSNKLRPADAYGCETYDCEKIERYLLSSLSGQKLARRFFPKSMGAWDSENPKPAQIFSSEPALNCARCSKSLLDEDAMGIVVSWTRYDEEARFETKKIEAMYWCCKGKCDAALEYSHRRKFAGCVDEWEDIPDLRLPALYFRWFMCVSNELHSGVTYSDAAFKANKTLLTELFPFVCRHMSETEKERMMSLAEMPAYF
jgi:restriction endonuclease